jgi:hypothetical protein
MFPVPFNSFSVLSVSLWFDLSSAAIRRQHPSKWRERRVFPPEKIYATATTHPPTATPRKPLAGKKFVQR